MTSDLLNGISINVNDYIRNITNNLSSVEVFVLPEWSLIIHVSTLTLLTLVALVGNGVIILVQHATRKKTSTDILVTSMAVCDVTLVMFNVPVMALSYGGSWPWIGSDTLCDVMAYIESIVLYCSSLLLTLTALDRYFKTCRPHENKLQPKTTLRICIGLFVTSLLICSSLFGSTRFDAEVTCTYEPNLSMELVILQMAVEGSYFVMFTVVAFAYIKIGLVIRKRARVRQIADPSVPRSNMLSSDAAPGTSKSTSRTTPAPNEDEKLGKQVPSPGVTRLQSANKRFRNKVTPMQVNVDPTSLTTTLTLPVESQNIESRYVIHSEIRCPSSQQTTHVPLDSDQACTCSCTGCTCNNAGDHNTANAGQNKDDTNNETDANDPRDEAVPSRLGSAREQPNANVTQQEYRSRQVNKTTWIMFSISLVFMASWVPGLVAYRVWPSQKGETVSENVVILLCRRFHFVNSISNPLFYIILSSKFRQTAKETLIKRWNALKRRFVVQ